MAANGTTNGPVPPYAMGGIVPTAGQNNDLVYVWGLVEELASQLQANRERFTELEAGIARSQIRPSESADDTNGDVNGAQDAIADITIKLNEAQKTILDLETTVTSQMRSMEDYSACLEKIKQMLSTYVYENQQATIAIHQHYSSLLESSRNETLQAHLTHQAWQASLSRVSEYVRMATKEKSEDSLPYRRKIAALKEENRLLRAKAGWDPPSDSEDEGRTAE
ncbi:hypothetical protein MBLNU457_6855t2 [Dothideomycetes sp. NU457]